MFAERSETSLQLLVKYGLLLVFTALGLFLAYSLLLSGEGDFITYLLVVIITITIIVINFIFMRNSLYPIRWMAPGLALMSIMIVFPVFYTIYMSLTNFGTGNLLTQTQVVDQFEARTYLPEEGSEFSWTAFIDEDENFLLWLVDGDGEGLLAGSEVSLNLDEVGAGPLDADGIPVSIPGYERLPRAQTLRYISALGEIPFGSEEDRAFVRSMDTVAQVVPKYRFDDESEVLTDLETGETYTAIDGKFTSDAGEALTPGYFVVIGGRNFGRIFNPSNPLFDLNSFVRIFIWTFVYSILVVISTFALGLFLALIFDDPTLPGRKLIQSLLLIPYAIPAFISVQVWKGMLNPEFGIYSKWLRAMLNMVGITEWFPSWFADPFWAKIGVLGVTLWLGFPYMFLICSGALQSIPRNIYEAAEIDGASVVSQFWRITFPLLLVSVGPLLIGSFAFNFNNFTVIDVYNEGKPPIPDAKTVAGHTDILISYIVRVAFTGGRGADYGYASALTILIFILLGLLVAYQFRYTRVWEEVSENV